MKKKVLKVLKSIGTLFIGILLLGVVTGLIYERIGLYKDSQRYKPPGKMVSINGHDIHVFAKGEGDATIVFLSGFGTPSPYADFYPLYDDISKYARIVVPERPGYGYSKETLKPRDIDSIAQELHESLSKAGESPPYILVAHSLGSLEAIRYTQLYKDEVKGLVMIDAGNPEYYLLDSTNPALISSMNLKGVLKDLGVIRLMFNHSKDFYNAAYSPRNQLSFIPSEMREMDRALYLKTMANRTKKEELLNMKNNAQIVMKNGPIGQIPLRILTSELEAADRDWKGSQEAFKSWSQDSMQRVVKTSPHYIHHYKPEQIINEIMDLIHSIDIANSRE